MSALQSHRRGLRRAQGDLRTCCWGLSPRTSICGGKVTSPVTLATSPSLSASISPSVKGAIAPDLASPQPIVSKVTKLSQDLKVERKSFVNFPGPVMVLCPLARSPSSSHPLFSLPLFLISPPSRTQFPQMQGFLPLFFITSKPLTLSPARAAMGKGCISTKPAASPSGFQTVAGFLRLVTL